MLLIFLSDDKYPSTEVRACVRVRVCVCVYSHFVGTNIWLYFCHVCIFM